MHDDARLLGVDVVYGFAIGEAPGTSQPEAPGIGGARVPGEINHALSQANLAQALVLVALVIMAAGGFVGVVEDQLVAKSVVVGGQRGAEDSKEGQLGGNHPGGHEGQAGRWRKDGGQAW